MVAVLSPRSSKRLCELRLMMRLRFNFSRKTVEIFYRQVSFYQRHRWNSASPTHSRTASRG